MSVILDIEVTSWTVLEARRTLELSQAELSTVQADWPFLGYGHCVLWLLNYPWQSEQLER